MNLEELFLGNEALQKLKKKRARINARKGLTAKTALTRKMKIKKASNLVDTSNLSIIKFR